MPDIIDATAVAVAPADGGTLVPASPTMIRPVGSYEDILDAWHEFGRVKAALLTPDDYATIQDRTFIKRSGWRKIAAAFGISTTIVSEQKTLLTPEHDGVSGYVWNVVARAEAPNGRVADGDGACYSGERRFTKPWHDIRATAHTRSINRAISNLVGGAELSAEEMEDPEPPQPRRVELPAPEPVGTDRDYSLVGKITSGQFTSHLRDSWEWTPADVCRVLWGREVEGGVNQYLKFRRRRGCADYGLGHLLHDLGGWHALHVPLPGLGPDVPGGRLGPDEEAD